MEFLVKSFFMSCKQHIFNAQVYIRVSKKVLNIDRLSRNIYSQNEVISPLQFWSWNPFFVTPYFYMFIKIDIWKFYQTYLFYITRHQIMAICTRDTFT